MIAAHDTGDREELEREKRDDEYRLISHGRHGDTKTEGGLNRRYACYRIDKVIYQAFIRHLVPARASAVNHTSAHDIHNNAASMFHMSIFKPSYLHLMPQPFQETPIVGLKIPNPIAAKTVFQKARDGPIASWSDPCPYTALDCSLLMYLVDPSGKVISPP